MDIPEILKATEFVAAMAGVFFGFFFTVIADVIRFYCRQRNHRNTINDEVKLVRESAIHAVRQYVKNDEIFSTSTRSPVYVTPVVNQVLANELIQVDAGLSLREKKCLRLLTLYNDPIKREYQKLSDCLSSDDKRKSNWERYNTSLAHYYTFVVYKCDEYFGLAKPIVNDVLDGDSFEKNNNKALAHIEEKLAIKLPVQRR